MMTNRKPRRARPAKTQLSVRLPSDLIERVDRYAAWLTEHTHVFASRTDAMTRLLAEAIDHHEAEHGPLPELADDEDS